MSVTDDSRKSSIRTGSAGGSTSDPPLFLGGRHFVETRASDSTTTAPKSRLGDHTDHTDPGNEALPDFHSEAALDSLPLTPPQSRGKSGSHADGVGASVTSVEAADYPIPAPEDEDLQAAVQGLNDQSRLLRRDVEAIHWLELTAEQLRDMLADTDSGNHIEYFDTKYFASQAQKVWEERHAKEREQQAQLRLKAAGETAPSSYIRPSAPSSILSRTKAAASGLNKSTDAPSSLHERAARNEVRRAAFRAAAVERQVASQLPSVRSSLLAVSPSSEAVRRTMYSPQRDLFGVSRPLVTLPAAATGGGSASRLPGTAGARLPPLPSVSPEERARSVSSLAAATDNANHEAEPADPAEDTLPPLDGIDPSAVSVPSAVVPAGGPSLRDRLAQQQESLSDLRTQDETVYKPVLEAFFRYDEAVQDKMSRLLEMNRLSNSADTPVAADSSESS